MTAAELAAYKQRAREMWGKGDLAAVTERQIWDIGKLIVERVGVRPGEDVLDVACGTGNAALRAAQVGGRVVGIDLTPRLFERGRALAAQAGVEVVWLEGDAEALPAGDQSFDVVLSTFGSMYAPRHDVAARELARVLRPGGRLGLCNWTSDSGCVRFDVVSPHVPAPPEFVSPPALWGSPDYVREIFSGTGIELDFERGAVEFEPFDSVDDEIEFMSTRFGPLVEARAHTESEGRWPALRADLAALFDRHEPSEYLLVLGRKRVER